MEHTTHDRHEPAKPTGGRTISIRIPTLSMPGLQSFVLILLIIAGLLQTVQLFGLQKNIASATIKSAAPAQAAAGAGGSSALPQMVGGC